MCVKVNIFTVMSHCIKAETATTSPYIPHYALLWGGGRVGGRVSMVKTFTYNFYIYTSSLFLARDREGTLHIPLPKGDKSLFVATVGHCKDIHETGLFNRLVFNGLYLKCLIEALNCYGCFWLLGFLSIEF